LMILWPSRAPWGWISLYDREIIVMPIYFGAFLFSITFSCNKAFLSYGKQRSTAMTWGRMGLTQKGSALIASTRA
jgi:hypothetical protein